MQRPVWYAVLMLLAATCFGLTSPIMKLAYQAGFSVQDITNVQYGWGLVILGVLWLSVVTLRRVHRNVLGRRQWILLVMIGIANAVTSFGYYQALTVLPASLGIVLLFQFTWMVLVMDAVVCRRIPGWEKIAGTLVILLGTFLAVGVRNLTNITSTMGSRGFIWAIGMGLLGGLGYATMLFLTGYVSDSSSPLFRSVVTMMISILVIAVPFHPTYLWSGVLWRGLWFWGLVVALSSQVIPLLLMLVAIPRIGGRMAGVLGSAELPVAVVSAHLLVGENVTLWRWSGVLLIIIGIAISEFMKKKTREANVIL